MLEKLLKLEPLVGNTPLTKLDIDEIDLYVKLEGYNFSGSIKDRPAFMIMKEALESGKINKDSIVIESSSGNFAISLAMQCRLLQIPFIAVIDKFINPGNEALLNLLCDEVIKVMEADETGGCLLNRVKKVESFISENPHAFWPNQYANELNPKAHYEGTGKEICERLERVDYIFVAVSSGGTITGLSQQVKEKFPGCKIIAVDAEGSVIFGGPPRSRPIPGMGSSMRPKVLEKAIIDEVVYVNEDEIIASCHALLDDHGLFLGGSSGGAFAAAKKYNYPETGNDLPVVVVISPDQGRAYMRNIYNPEWVANLKQTASI